VSTHATRAERGWLPAFALLACIWGASFLFIKVAVDAFEPVQVAFGRNAVGALTLLGLLVARRERLPRDRRVWLHVMAVAVFFNSVPFVLFAFGETKVTSVVAGIWNATTPLNTLVVALALLPDERPTRERVSGLIVGFAGVLIVLGPWTGLGGLLIGNIACFGAAVCYGFGYPYTRRFLAGRSDSAISLSAAQVSCGALQLLPFVVFTSDAPDSVPLDSAASLLALGAGATGIAYVVNYFVIRRAGATTASSVTYLVPLVSTALGVAVLGERLSWNQPVGAAVVLLGVALSQGRLRRRPLRS
jgi:drug/metabolite transporter (DMT)-like permease